MDGHDRNVFRDLVEVVARWMAMRGEYGKLADLAILDRNPLKGDPMTIEDIKVLKTVKEGTTIYQC